MDGVIPRLVYTNESLNWRGNRKRTLSFIVAIASFYFANRSYKTSHQEEHPLLEALPRELAEAPEPDELLEDVHKMNALVENSRIS